jgi:hypothetical protein
MPYWKKTASEFAIFRIIIIIIIIIILLFRVRNG